MEERKTKKPGVNEKVGDRGTDDEQIPFCTNAPSAEHARANVDDEPCDDGREGHFQ